MLHKLIGAISLTLLAIVVSGVKARAADALPITGTYGEVEGKGCDSYTEETEGPYFIIHEDGRGYGSGGECGCKVTSVKETGEDAYSFVAVCQCIDSPNKETETSTLFILSDTEIELDGTKYQKCEPLP